MAIIHLPVDLAKLMGVMHMEVDKVADIVVEVDMVCGKAAARTFAKNPKNCRIC